MDEPGRGKVLQVVDDHTVVVSLGTATTPSISPDDRVLIFVEGEEVTDPDTNEVLGKVEWVKARLKVTHSQERFSTAETPLRFEEVRVPRNELFLDVIYGPLKKRAVRESFAVDKSALHPRGVDLRVRVGDLVRKDET